MIGHEAIGRYQKSSGGGFLSQKTMQPLTQTRISEGRMPIGTAKREEMIFPADVLGGGQTDFSVKENLGHDTCTSYRLSILDYMGFSTAAPTRSGPLHSFGRTQLSACSMGL